MKNNLTLYKLLTYTSISLSAIIIYLTFKIGPSIGGRAYQIGIALFILFVVISSSLFDKTKKIQEIQYLIHSWPEAYDSKFDFNKIHKFYEEYGADKLKEKDFYNIDEQTAYDINIDDLLKEISICSSTPGEQMLYYLLRTPKLNAESLEKRNKIIEKFLEDKDLRGNIQQIFSDLGRQRKGEIFNLFNTNTVIKKWKVILFNLIALSSLILLILFLFIGSNYTLKFIGIFAIYMLISMRASAEIENELSSLQYLGDFVRAAKEISKIEDETLEEYIKEITKRVIPISKIDSKTKYIYTSSELDIFTETLNGFFLTKIRSYYSIINIVKSNRQNLSI